MADSACPSIFVDQAVSVSLRNSTVRVVFGLERSGSSTDERVELLLPVSTASDVLIGVLNGINRLRLAAEATPTVHQLLGPR